MKETKVGISPSRKALHRLLSDKWGTLSLALILLYLGMALLIKFGLFSHAIQETVGASYGKPDWPHILGTDIFGRNVFLRVLYGAKIAMFVGLVTAIIAVPIGILMGALGGFFGGKVDDFVVWLYTTLSSIPYLLLLLALTFVLGKGITSVYIALGATSWVGICRVVRGEFLKYRERDFVMAARALGAGPLRIIFLHVLPNVMPLIFINTSLLFVGAIKSEVILSYLGVGVQGEPSWGIMISDARMELIGRGVYWQLLGATSAMIVIILALNIFADALRDAFDPRMTRAK